MLLGHTPEKKTFIFLWTHMSAFGVSLHFLGGSPSQQAAKLLEPYLSGLFFFLCHKCVWVSESITAPNLADRLDISHKKI